MVTSCGVAGCRNRAASNKEKKAYYSLPGVIKSQGPLILRLSMKRREAWLKSLGRKINIFDAPKSLRVCSDHFHTGKPATLEQETHPDWIPTVDMGGTKKASNIGRYVRILNREKRKLEMASQQQKKKAQPKPIASLRMEVEDYPNSGLTDNEEQSDTSTSTEDNKELSETATSSSHEEDVQLCFSSTEDELSEASTASADESRPYLREPQVIQVVKLVQGKWTKKPITSDKATTTFLTMEKLQELEMQQLKHKMDLREKQTELFNLQMKIHDNKCTEESFNDAKTRFYTGFPTKHTLMQVYNLCKNSAEACITTKLSLFQSFIMTMMRLKLNLSITDLSYRFDVSSRTIGRLITLWIDFLFDKFQVIFQWPERSDMSKALSQSFKDKFGTNSLAVFAQCIEISLTKPPSREMQKELWSREQNCYTVKFFLGLNVHGYIGFVSKSWGGSCTPKYIAENCGFLELLEDGDFILSDSSFHSYTSDDLFCGQVNISDENVCILHDVSDEVDSTPIEEFRMQLEFMQKILQKQFKVLQDLHPFDSLTPSNTESVPKLEKVMAIVAALYNIAVKPSLVDAEVCQLAISNVQTIDPNQMDISNIQNVATSEVRVLQDSHITSQNDITAVTQPTLENNAFSELPSIITNNVVSLRNLPRSAAGSPLVIQQVVLPNLLTSATQKPQNSATNSLAKSPNSLQNTTQTSVTSQSTAANSPAVSSISSKSTAQAIQTPKNIAPNSQSSTMEAIQAPRSIAAKNIILAKHSLPTRKEAIQTPKNIVTNSQNATPNSLQSTTQAFQTPQSTAANSLIFLPNSFPSTTQTIQTPQSTATNNLILLANSLTSTTQAIQTPQSTAANNLILLPNSLQNTMQPFQTPQRTATNSFIVLPNTLPSTTQAIQKTPSTATNSFVVLQNTSSSIMQAIQTPQSTAANNLLLPNQLPSTTQAIQTPQSTGTNSFIVLPNTLSNTTQHVLKPEDIASNRYVVLPSLAGSTSNGLIVLQNPSSMQNILQQPQNVATNNLFAVPNNTQSASNSGGLIVLQNSQQSTKQDKVLQTVTMNTQSTTQSSTPSNQIMLLNYPNVASNLQVNSQNNQGFIVLSSMGNVLSKPEDSIGAKKKVSLKLRNL